MNSEAFLRTLRAGLAGLSKQEADEIIAGYEAHFAEAPRQAAARRRWLPVRSR